MARHVPRIFCAQPISAGATLRLDSETSHHLLRVLRLMPGAELRLFDGRGGEYPAVIAGAGRDWVEARAGIRRDLHSESPLMITLAQGISRGERMDYTLQKAVELGVHAIVPLETERGVTRLSGGREEKKLRHWQAIARSAAEQAGRERVPQVLVIQEYAAWVATAGAAGMRLVLDPAARRGLAGLSPTGDSVTLLAGPEGGLTDREICAATNAGFVGLRLGPRVLRTETAGVAAIAAIQALWGDLGR